VSREDVLPRVGASQRPLLLVLAAAVAASGGLLRAGLPDTHDGLFHFFRMMALDEAVGQGCCFPRWLPQFAFGYGQPVFTFYGAAAYYQALSGHLVGLGAEAALKLSWFMGFATAGAGAYGLARRWMHGSPAALVGAAYVLFPYRLANVYVRGALAEHWGLALLPLLLLVGERALERGTRADWTRLALVWAALVLTHHLSAFLAVPLLAAYLLVCGWRRTRRLAITLAAPVAGTLLTAFYWLPVLTEVRLVGLGQTFSTDAWQRFLVPLLQIASPTLLYRYYPQQGVAHEYPLGLVTIGLGLLAALALVVARPRGAGGRARLVHWGVVGLICLALQWTATALVWEAVPLLGFLQFPWRLMGPFALAWAVLLGAGVDGLLRWRPGVGGLTCVALAVVLAVASLWHLPGSTVAASEQHWAQQMWDHDAAIGQVGATWTAEYVPVWVTVDRSAMPWDPVESDRPPLVRLPDDARVRVTGAGLYSVSLDVSVPSPVRLSWHSFHYPGQSVTVDGVAVGSEPYTDLGLASAAVPAGSHAVRWSVGASAAARGGGLLSGLVAAGLVLVAARGRRRWALPLALAALVATYWATGCGARESAVQPAWVPFERDVALVGWQSEATRRAGDEVTLDLYWLARATPQENYKVFAHLESPLGEVRSQSDGDLVGGYTRTTRMVGGEVVLDRRRLGIPEGSEPGRYAVYVGLYRWPEVSNLAVSEGEQEGNQRALLGYVEVLP